MNKIFKNLTEEQQNTIKMLIDRGGTLDKNVPNIVWILGRCILIQRDGTYDEI